MKKTLCAIALAAALPLSAQAAAPSYTWIQGDYVRADDADADGFGVRGNVAFGESDFYGLGSYRSVTADTFFGDVDLSQFELGAGYALSLSDNADLIAELAWQNVEADAFGASADTDGYRASVGSRIGFNDYIEGLARLNYIDGSDVDGDVTGTLGLLVKFNPTWGVAGEIETDGDGGEFYSVGVRASF